MSLLLSVRLSVCAQMAAAPDEDQYVQSYDFKFDLHVTMDSPDMIIPLQIFRKEDVARMDHVTAQIFGH